MPLAQLRITVQPGTFSPQPRRSAATRPMFTSSTEGAAQPRITSSSSCGANFCRESRVRPACTARSPAANGPGRFLRFQERRAGAVDDVNGDSCHAAFACTGRASPSFSMISARPKSCGKSSTRMTRLRSASFLCHCAYSSAVMTPWSRASSAVSTPERGAQRAALHRLAELLLDRLAGHRGEERRLQHAGRVRLALGHVDAGGQAVARGAGLERDARALVVARIQRRAERHAEREDGPAQEASPAP